MKTWRCNKSKNDYSNRNSEQKQKEKKRQKENEYENNVLFCLFIYQLSLVYPTILNVRLITHWPPVIYDWTTNLDPHLIAEFLVSLTHSLFSSCFMSLLKVYIRFRLFRYMNHGFNL